MFYFDHVFAKHPWNIRFIYKNDLVCYHYFQLYLLTFNVTESAIKLPAKNYSQDNVLVVSIKRFKTVFNSLKLSNIFSKMRHSNET